MRLNNLFCAWSCHDVDSIVSDVIYVQRLDPIYDCVQMLWIKYWLCGWMYKDCIKKIVEKSSALPNCITIHCILLCCFYMCSIIFGCTLRESKMPCLSPPLSLPLSSTSTSLSSMNSSALLSLQMYNKCFKSIFPYATDQWKNKKTTIVYNKQRLIENVFDGYKVSKINGIKSDLPPRTPHFPSPFPFFTPSPHNTLSVM